MQIKLNEMSENANKSERFHTNNAAPATLRAEVTFSQCELACEKQPLPTTVQIRPEIWTNKLRKRIFFLFLTGLEHYVSPA